jgi:hypothetical protein
VRILSALRSMRDLVSVETDPSAIGRSRGKLGAHVTHQRVGVVISIS